MAITGAQRLEKQRTYKKIVLGKWKLMLTEEEWETFLKSLYLVGYKNPMVNKTKAMRIQVERRLRGG